MKEINKIFIVISLVLLVVVIFFDKDSLNSLMIKEEEININEIAIASANPSKVVYNTQIEAVQNPQTTIASNIATDTWAWPTEKEYTITTYFSSGHNAIDIYSYKGHGSAIYAANNGTVAMVRGGCTPGYLSCNGRAGNYIVINHNSNNYYTVYMHLNSINIKEGDTVSKGQVIGTMGNTGNVIPAPSAYNPYGGTHLHFSLYIGMPFSGGYAINPLRLY